MNVQEHDSYLTKMVELSAQVKNEVYKCIEEYINR